MKVVIIDKDGKEQHINPSKIIINEYPLDEWFKKLVQLENKITSIQKEIKVNNEKLIKLVDSI